MQTGARLILTCLLAAFHPISSSGQQSDDQAQTKPRNVGLSADLFSQGVDASGTAVQRLIGNVQLSEDETWLRADSATQYPDQEILFTGNVVAIERGDTLYADRVFYDRRSKVGRAFGRVRFTDGDVVVTAPAAVHHTSDKRTEFESGVTLVDSTSELTSESGTYWSESKRAHFRGAVQLRMQDASVHAESLEYERKAETSTARDNVLIFAAKVDSSGGRQDTLSWTMITSGWAFSDERAGLKRVRDDVLLQRVRFDSSGVDTLLLRAALLDVLESDSLEEMFASGDVRIWNMDTFGIADSVVYERQRQESGGHETLALLRDPIGWFNDSQVTGDSIWIFSSDGGPDSLRVTGDTFLAQQDTVLSRIQQVRGQTLIGRYADAGREMVVSPNAEALYFMLEDGEAGGVVQTSADRIAFEFEGDEMTQVRAEGGVQGTYYPEERVAEAPDLDGLIWVPERRPRKSDFALDDSKQERASSAELPFILLPRVPPRKLKPAAGPTPASPRLIDVAAGGYTIVVSSEESRAEAESIGRLTASLIADRGWPVDVLPAEVDGQVFFRVGVGQFRTAQSAAEAMAESGDVLPADAWVSTIVKGPSGFAGDARTPPRAEAWSPGGIERDNGGYGLVIASRDQWTEAAELARNASIDLEAENLTIDVLAAVVDGRQVYRVVLGPFAGRRDAVRTLARLRDRVPEGTWVLRILPG